MSYTIVGAIIVPLVIVVIAVLMDSSSGSRCDDESATEPTVFRSSPWVFVPIVIFGGIASSFFFFYGPADPWITRVLLQIIGTLGLVVTIASAWWYSKCRVEVDIHEVRIVTPIGAKCVRFADIKLVRRSNGFIVLDEGKIPRTIIPATYRNSHQMLAMIERRTGKETSIRATRL